MKTTGAIINICVMSFALVVTGCKTETLEPLKTGIGPIRYVDLDAQFCTSPRASAKQNIKYIFVIDHSGSNKVGTVNTGVSNDVVSTDPFGASRYEPLVSLLRDLEAYTNPANASYDPNTNMSFALIDFNVYAYQPGNINPIRPPNRAPILKFNKDPRDFRINYVEPDWMGASFPDQPPRPRNAQGSYIPTGPYLPLDQDNTDYISALNLIKGVIQADAQNAQAEFALGAEATAATYKIIFVSDGMPNTFVFGGNNGGNSQNGMLVPEVWYDATAEAYSIQPVVAEIMGLQRNVVFGKYISNISLNTVLYSRPTSTLSTTPILINGQTYPSQAQTQQDACTLLQLMSREGNGQFQLVGENVTCNGVQGTGNQVNYQVFAPQIRSLKYHLADVWVDNLNLVYWDDGILRYDTDRDAIPDEIEARMGSNPTTSDSDYNGVSDLVEYRTKGKPCNGSGCSIAGRDQYMICAGYLPFGSKPSGVDPVVFLSSSKDGLNDCEKSVLGAKRELFDSNGDFLPDFLALRNLVALIPGSYTLFMNPFGDEFDNYQKLKRGYPLTESQEDMPDNFETRNTKITHLPSVDEQEEGQECYHLTVEKVAISSENSNFLKVSVIENTALVDDKPSLRTAVRTVSGNESLVEFAPGDFQ